MSRRIESPANPTVKSLARLLRRRHRNEEGRFLIEGRREVERAVAAGIEIEMVLVCPELGGATGAVDALDLSAAAFRKISVRQNPDGIIAVAATYPLDLDGVTSAELVLVTEAMEKPGNIGAMLRTVDATGAALAMADPVVDPFNPNVIRASQGSVFAVPVAGAPAEAVRARIGGTHHIVIAAPEAEETLWEADLSGPTAFVIGAERTGVSDVWRGLDRVTIPMSGSADSLNASVAAAVLLYEAVRRRG